MIEERDTYGVAVIDRREATIASMKGKKINVLTHITSGVPGKHKAGGQSQRRFDRVIEQAAHEFLKRIGDHMNDDFIPLKDDLKGIIIGGPGFTKNDFADGDYLNYELKQKILTIEDTSYTGEFGIREVIDKSAGALEELDIVKEKKLVQKFLHELHFEHGLASYGEKEITNNLQIGAVDTLLLSEELKSKKLFIECPVCGHKEEKTLKEHQSLDDLTCPECNEKMEITKEDDLIEYLVGIAENMGSSVELISTETDEGMQLYRGFGGIAGILRYHVG
jgi:peptide chain release factor subunit 1